VVLGFSSYDIAYRLLEESPQQQLVYIALPVHQTIPASELYSLQYATTTPTHKDAALNPGDAPGVRCLVHLHLSTISM
jgi:hypothetical protein